MTESPATPVVPQPIETAPNDRDVLVFNHFVGWYRTRFEDGEWPLLNLCYPGSIHYPVPVFWADPSGCK